MIRERAFAKVNLVLQVGQIRADGLHELCSLVASIDLADELVIEHAGGAEDNVVCPGVEGPNLVNDALALFRAAVGDGAGRGSSSGGLPPLKVAIAKRTPVAGGLGGGSADAAAVLRAANRLAGHPLDLAALRRLAAGVGSDVPALLEPRHALVGGAGEEIEPVQLPPMALVLVPQPAGLRTPEVYAEADRLGATRSRLEPEAVRRLAGAPLEQLGAGLENDLERAARSLRPELAAQLDRLRETGALAALVSGSGPTVFGVFANEPGAQAAANAIDGALVTGAGATGAVAGEPAAEAAR